MTRVALVLVSLAAAAWLASAYPGTRAEQQAREIRPERGGELTESQVARSIALLEDAGQNRPDGEVAVKLAGLELTAGRADRAVALLRPLVRREPENVSAWAALAVALGRTDPEGAREARARQLELAPPVEP